MQFRSRVFLPGPCYLRSPSWPDRRSLAFALAILACCTPWGTDVVSARGQEEGPIASVQSMVEAEIEKLGPAGGIWGVYAAEVESGRCVVDLQGGTLLLPASNRKIFTTSLALAQLGSGFRFQTRVWAVGEIDSEGTLRGDLVLEASGDPTLRPAFLNGGSGLGLLNEWARKVSDAGIQHVSGKVRVDCSVYQQPAPMPPGWAWDQLTELYGALPSALAVNENRVLVKVSPGRSAGDPCAVETVPDAGESLGVKNEARTAGGSGRNTLRVVRGTGPAALVVLGELPAGNPTATLTLPVPDPVSVWAVEFGKLLDRGGVAFEGPVEVTTQRVAPEAEGPGKRKLVEHNSPPLDRILRWTNKESDNQCAEMLYLAAGWKAFGQGSYESAQAAEKVYLRSLGVDPDLVAGEDGSGLGRTDLAAPQALVKALRALSTSPESEFFVESLPVSGKDGTLRYRMSKGEVAGRVLAKTGTLRDVCALSGYVVRGDGERIAFSILVNHYTRPVASIRKTQDRICEILYGSRLTR